MIEEAQERVIEGLAKRLRGTPTVFNLTGKRIGIEGGDAVEGLPSIVVGPGKHWPAPQSEVAVLRQVNVVVTYTATDEAGVLKLAGIARRAMGSAGFEFEKHRFICQDTGPAKLAEDEKTWTVRDVWATFHTQPPAE